MRATRQRAQPVAHAAGRAVRRLRERRGVAGSSRWREGGRSGSTRRRPECSAESIAARIQRVARAHRTLGCWGNTTYCQI